MYEEFELAHEFSIPVLAPSLEPIELDREFAPYAVLDSEGMDVLAPASAAMSMTPALGSNLPSSSETSGPAKLSLPALAASLEQATPAAASEVMAEVPIASADAQYSAAEPHSGAPVAPVFGNSVRIKNWRLKITFAKPA
jgi:hypothetical protein